MECLSLEMLGRHLDNELDPETHQDIATHIRTCPGCSEQWRQLQEHHALLNSVLPGPRVSVPAGRPCYSPEVLSAYAAGLLALQEAPDLETHLSTCDGCMDEVIACRRTLRLLRGGAPTAPPAHLVAAVQQQWAGRAHQSRVERLGTVVLQVAADGLTFIEALLVPAYVRLAIRGQLLPMGALRSTQEAVEVTALVDIQQTVRDLEIQMRVFHESQATVLLQVQLRQHNTPLARRRVILASHAVTLASHPTSASGEVRFPRLVPGEYTMRIPQENLETHLIVRAPAQP